MCHSQHIISVRVLLATFNNPNQDLPTFDGGFDAVVEWYWNFHS